MGNGGGDRLFGRGGDDRLEGGDGYDTLFGGSGKDTLVSGHCADRVLMDSADTFTDYNRNEDAKITFVNSDSKWTDAEIEVVNRAFGMKRTVRETTCSWTR